jgi:small subunit ribosomal protein S15
LVKLKKMANYLTKEKKAEIFAKHGGSIEGQIALFTYRIKELMVHLGENKKDHACRRSLLTLVGKRKRFLKYLAANDIEKYRSLIEELNIRK